MAGPAPLAKRPRVSSSSGNAGTSGERRHFMPSWKNEFPWVTAVNGVMRCQYCIEAKKRNIFATTGCDKFKKDALRKHALTRDHRAAVEAKTGRRDMQRTVATTYRHQELAVRAAFMAKKTSQMICSVI